LPRWTSTKISEDQGKAQVLTVFVPVSLDVVFILTLFIGSCSDAEILKN